MADKPRRIKIELTLLDGYESLITETIYAPATTDLPILGTMVEHKIGSMLDTANDLYPPKKDTEPVTSETTLSY